MAPIAIATAGALALVALLARRRLPGLIELMMESAMPAMMDRCFAAMSPERREFMLAHCRGALDAVEEKYVRAEGSPPPPDVERPGSEPWSVARAHPAS
jgi:hypothetical protein